LDYCTKSGTSDRRENNATKRIGSVTRQEEQCVLKPEAGTKETMVMIRISAIGRRLRSKWNTHLLMKDWRPTIFTKDKIQRKYGIKIEKMCKN